MDALELIHSSEHLVVLSIGSCEAEPRFPIQDSEVLVVMPTTNLEQALRAQGIMQKRASYPALYVVALDRNKQGFVSVFNFVTRNFRSEYAVYCAQDAFPGNSWLKIAVDYMRVKELHLLAFNDGKWHGALASFGLMRTYFFKQVYSGDLFFPGYKSHAADNEVTYIAMACKKYSYLSDAVLIEIDYEKDLNLPKHSVDTKILFERMNVGIDTPLGRVRLVENTPRLISQNE